MTRERPAGSFSSRNPSPCQNSVGGVERSTSRTNPGRGISDFPYRWRAGARRAVSTGPLLLKPQVERDLHGASATGVGGVLDGGLVVGQRIGSRHQAAQLRFAYEGEGEVEGASAAAVGQRLGAGGVGAGQH